MDFPATNKSKNQKKIEEDLQEKLDSNAKKIEDKMKSLDTEYLFKMYLKGLGLLSLFLFTTIATIKLVFLIFDVIYLWL